MTINREFKFHDILIAWSPLNVDWPSTVYNDYAIDIERQALQAGKLVGVCNISGTPTDFKISHHNLRETVIANSSGSNNRQRQLVCAISIALFNHPNATIHEIAHFINYNNLKVYTAEARAALFSGLKRLIRPDLFFCSEYFGPESQSGQIVNGVRHEDLQQTSFADETFDIILTSEVFEHIPDAIKAEREVVRILKKGGFYCFTVPFMPYAEHDEIRASLDVNGQVIHHAPPEYHGNAVHPEDGSLVYRTFSQRDMQRRFSDLGCQFMTFQLWSRSLGILGNNQMVHVVRKPAKQPDAPPAVGDSDIWKRVSQLPGLDMNDSCQLHLLREAFPAFAHEYSAIPHEKPADPHLFYLNNPMFSGTDALAVYCMIRHYKPRLVLEIGNGMLTRISAQAALLNGETKLVAIEAHPDETMRAGFPGLSSVIAKPLETVDLGVFQELQSGDMLVIDTSYMGKNDGDIPYPLFLEVLPLLNRGVMVHLHDVYLPREYPRISAAPVLNRLWIEQYLLQAFMVFNSEFEVLLSNTYLATKYLDDMKKTFPNSPWWGGGSFWIRRKI